MNYRGLCKYKLPSFSLFGPPAFHLGAGDISLFVNKIKVSFFSLDAAFGYLFWAAPLFLASGHLGAGDISLFIHIVEETFLPLDSDLGYFLCHILIHLLSLFVLNKFL